MCTYGQISRRRGRFGPVRGEFGWCRMRTLYDRFSSCMRSFEQYVGRDGDG
ncbi:hypothetical protein JOD67_002001 [Tenggerimyces flavus]|nr:hypothetical protein [Tenggerimyces flavus]